MGINRVTYYMILGIAVGVLIGIIIGMFLQQMIIEEGVVRVAEGLEGTTFNIEVDINETEMADRFIEFFNETEFIEDGN